MKKFTDYFPWIMGFWKIKTHHPVPGDALSGASDVTRTRDLLITSEMHYRLCYTSIEANVLYPFQIEKST